MFTHLFSLKMIRKNFNISGFFTSAPILIVDSFAINYLYINKKKKNLKALLTRAKIILSQLDEKY